MQIEQTVCDHCGKIHENDPGNPWALKLMPKMSLKVPDKVMSRMGELKDGFKMKGHDFCDENCVRDFLVVRHEASLHNAQVELPPKGGSDFKRDVPGG